MSLVGETQEIDIDVVTIDVPYPGGESGTNTYDAPAGLAILEYHKVERTNKGRSGCDFSVTGDGSVFVNDQTVESKFKQVFDYIEQNGKNEYRNRIDQLKEEAKRISQLTASTHSRITTNWHCRHNGNDLDRKGGALDLGLHIKLIRGVYSTNLNQIINKIIEAISNSKRPEEIQLAV